MQFKFISTLTALLLIMSSTVSANRILFTSLDNKPAITIIEKTKNSITLSIIANNLSLKDKEVNGDLYEIISLKKYGRNSVIGKPNLPFIGLKLATSSTPNISYEIINDTFDIIDSILVYPNEQPSFAATEIVQRDRFRKEEKTYNSNCYYPSSPIQIIETVDYKGQPITTVGIMPILHNPVEKSIKVFKKLTVKITFNSPNQPLPVTENSISIIKNIVLNPNSVIVKENRGIGDFDDDVIIITTPKFNKATEKLARWQKKKGYDVNIVSHISWTTDEIKTTVKELYNSATVKPSYLLIIGDNEDVPGEMVESLFKGYGTDTHVTDNNYVCMDGGTDYLGDMARGRISAKTDDEATIVVNKIINYETNPPTKESFYTNALSCGFFQSYTSSKDENDDPKTADRRFVQTVEEILNFLDDNHSIKSDRIYCADDDINPTYYNDGQYSWGEDVPEYLKRPSFAWDGNAEDIAARLNDGRFLMYHYDHGYEGGWGDPAFSSNQVRNLLNNGDLLPLVYSIDCLVGRFDYSQDCFAEVISKKADGGAVAIVAATTLSSSGNNEALLMGMIDATWPGLVLKTPRNSDPIINEHKPIYNMGDIMNQGFLRMGDTWSSNSKYHNTMYHLFGDPTTPLWTKVPMDITESHDENIAINSNSFKISGLNITNGVATLYNRKNDAVVGKIEINNEGTITIPITNPLGDIGDSLNLTITSHNYIPIQKSISIVNPVSITHKKAIAKEPLITINRNSAKIIMEENSPVSFFLYDVRGRTLFNWSSNDSPQNNVLVDFSEVHLSTGVYLIKFIIQNKSISRQLKILD